MLILDTEVYKDYFLLSLMRLADGKTRHFETFRGREFDGRTVAAIMCRNTTISFNGLAFDLPIIAAACSGASTAELKRICDAIITSEKAAWITQKELGLTIPETWDHIDLINVAPGQASLKLYAGRMNAPTIQDLPIDPAASISPDRRALLRQYCENDLKCTAMLYDTLKSKVDLRAAMSEQYGTDLRSKSDAQIAETVIKSELGAKTGVKYKPQVDDGRPVRFRDPGNIEFAGDQLRETFAKILQEPFKLKANGSVNLPEWLEKTPIVIGGASYAMGVGGLHSREKSQVIRPTPDQTLADWDVTSYYPSIIQASGLHPATMGPIFNTLYQSFIDRRVKAKQTGDTVVSETLKIVLNGSFGKFGSKYSALYSPQLLIQTTISGQLYLLMLIERLTLIGVRVVSANTDGIVILHDKADASRVQYILWGWMMDTSFNLEGSEYKLLASRDVNNYLAVKIDGKVKGKGVFAETGLAKNPNHPIVTRAVADFLSKGTPVETTINACDDVRQFCAVRRVTGGASFKGELIGKVVRWYMSNKLPDSSFITYAKNGNRVPLTCRAQPLMTLPDEMPDDIDRSYYIAAARDLLKLVGVKNA